jgi:putative heme iron utilization protein
MKLCGAEDSKAGGLLWRIAGIDPEGLDLGRGDVTLRLPFPQRVSDAGQLRQVVVELAAKARIA